MKALPLAFAVSLSGCGPSVASIGLDQSSVTLRMKGETKTIKATPLNAKGELAVEALLALTWTSSDPNVATVSKGAVTAVKSGEATISAAVGKTIATSKVLVSIPAKMSFEPDHAEILGVGNTIVVAPVVRDERDKPAVDPQVVWSTSSSTVAMVVEGKVEAIGPGSARIMAAVGPLKATTTVTVNIPPIARLEVTPPGPHTLEKVGDALRLQALATDDAKGAIKGASISWTSSEPAIASVTNEGLVTAAKKGKAKITAAAGERTADVEVTVKGAK